MAVKGPWVAVIILAALLLLYLIYGPPTIRVSFHDSSWVIHTYLSLRILVLLVIFRFGEHLSIQLQRQEEPGRIKPPLVNFRKHSESNNTDANTEFVSIGGFRDRRTACLDGLLGQAALVCCFTEGFSG
jgi:hypothetical protein